MVNDYILYCFGVVFIDKVLMVANDYLKVQE